MSGTNGLPGNSPHEAIGRPAGGSIGRALIIRPGVLNDDLRAAVAAIDRVHGVADLPRIPIELRAGMRERGRILFDSDTGVPSRILVRANANHRTLTTLHEIGHFLDLTAFRHRRTFGSISSPIMDPWSRATTQSNAYRELIRLRGTDITVIAETMLVPPELWARCYAQYIPLRSGDGSLFESLSALRIGQSAGLHIPVQWNDNDFDEIAGAIDLLFESLGWRA